MIHNQMPKSVISDIISFHKKAGYIFAGVPVMRKGTMIMNMHYYSVFKHLYTSRISSTSLLLINNWLLPIGCCSHQLLNTLYLALSLCGLGVWIRLHINHRMSLSPLPSQFSAKDLQQISSGDLNLCSAGEAWLSLLNHASNALFTKISDSYVHICMH